MRRVVDEWVAGVADLFGMSVPTMLVLSFLLAAVVGALWYSWPAWLPTNWTWRSRERTGPRERRSSRANKLGRLRWRGRRRRRQHVTDEPEPPVLADDQVPDLPSTVLTLTADQLAAAGRYAEAVRERLRAMLRALMERDLLPTSPGWTVMELAATGARVRPAMAAPLRAAAALFSEIWYGLRPATADDDAAMRGYAEQVAAVEPAESRRA
jgi:hypothetical protein